METSRHNINNHKMNIFYHNHKIKDGCYSREDFDLFFHWREMWITKNYLTN